MTHPSKLFNLEHLKSIDPNWILSGLGALEVHGSKPYHLSRKWNLQGTIIVVTGKKWFNNSTCEGGKNSINLLMSLFGYEFVEACQKLSEFDLFGGEVYLATTEMNVRRFRLDDHVDETDEHWERVRDYLEMPRLIDRDLIQKLHEERLLLADERGNCCFVTAGNLGVLKRGIYDPTPPKKAFKQKCGKGFFILHGRSNRNIVVEGPIDGLSVRMMYPNDTVIVTGGNFNPDELRCVLGNKITLAATDNDSAGDMLAQVLAHEFGAVRLRPKNGNTDWNEMLRSLLVLGDKVEQDD